MLSSFFFVASGGKRREVGTKVKPPEGFRNPEGIRPGRTRALFSSPCSRRCSSRRWRLFSVSAKKRYSSLSSARLFQRVAGVRARGRYPREGAASLAPRSRKEREGSGGESVKSSSGRSPSPAADSSFHLSRSFRRLSWIPSTVSQATRRSWGRGESSWGRRSRRSSSPGKGWFSRQLRSSSSPLRARPSGASPLSIRSRISILSSGRRCSVREGTRIRETLSSVLWVEGEKVRSEKRSSPSKSRRKGRGERGEKRSIRLPREENSPGERTRSVAV
ncbi:MAG: hypothetical protein BWY86_01326 [Candidatus Aminicenantes bacterium ADurb.Bin508]|nr:MAG: hypothetical protein BWY86_01326 [Candidatus Aminicenantes bacterium ADurb.Bin508]